MSGRDWRPLDFFTAGADLGCDSFELHAIHHDPFAEIRPVNFRLVSPQTGCAHTESKDDSTTQSAHAEHSSDSL